MPNDKKKLKTIKNGDNFDIKRLGNTKQNSLEDLSLKKSLIPNK